MAVALLFSTLAGLTLNIQAGHTLLALTTTAILTHHVRDAHRRGIWLWPVETSVDVSYSGYLWFVLLVWPACLWFWLERLAVARPLER